MISIIKDKIKDNKYVKEDILFTNLTSLINDMFTITKPNLYINVRFKKFNRNVRNELNDSINSIIQNDLFITSNFFLKTKELNESLIITGRQVCYDDVLKIKDMYSLMSYK